MGKWYAQLCSWTYKLQEGRPWPLPATWWRRRAGIPGTCDTSGHSANINAHHTWRKPQIQMKVSLPTRPNGFKLIFHNSHNAAIITCAPKGKGRMSWSMSRGICSTCSTCSSLDCMVWYNVPDHKVQVPGTSGTCWQQSVGPGTVSQDRLSYALLKIHLPILPDHGN